MPWKFKTKLDKLISETNDAKKKGVMTTLQLEIDRIAIQVCAYCDGNGHSGNDCPTDYKLM